jgi:hypothetical protein
MTSILERRLSRASQRALFGAAVLACAAAVEAGPPRVHFDVSYSVDCRDVTPEAFAVENPQSKIIEARFQVSSLIERGNERDVEELMYVVWSPEKRLRVVDFEPKTQMGSEVTDAVQVVESGEKASSFDGGVNVQFEPWAGVHVAPSAGASKASKKKSEQKYSQRPPKQLLVASGTTRRQFGVFFKMKPSTQDSLQGQKQFVCLFVVPQSWRGDYVYVDCIAKARDRSPWSSPQYCGTRRVLVGLYLQGDAEAKEAAERPAYAYESYVAAGGRVSGDPESDEKAGQKSGGLLRRFPGSSLVESVIDDLAIEKREDAKKKDQAWESFQSAVEELSRFTG